MINRSQFAMWRRQVFRRHPHEDLRELYLSLKRQTGIYLIGCEDKIVYIGQSWKLCERPIESLGKLFREADDPTLRWSLGLAPCPHEEMNERESTAIRAYAPKFNTSIPSIPASLGRMPEIVGYASVFADQYDDGGAFNPQNMQTQMKLAAIDPSPPWRQGKQRKKTGPREKRTSPTEFAPIKMLVGEALHQARRDYGVPFDGDMIYPINLCDDGYVVTNDGECIGVWLMDNYAMPYFVPLGETEPTIEAMLIGHLCAKIRNWHEAQD